MPLETPSKLELDTIHELIDFADRRVLEIGAGDGRLSWPFAAAAARWVAMDPDAEELRQAAHDLQTAPYATLHLSLGDARQLSFPDASFDIVFFTWSLC